MIIKTKTIKRNVQLILEKFPKTRSSDHLLYVYYIEKILRTPLTRKSFIRYKQSFEGISRARRKVQQENPDLKAIRKKKNVKKSLF